MKLKQLQERASWQKLDEKEFKDKIIHDVLKQSVEIETLHNLITSLQEDLEKVKTILKGFSQKIDKTKVRPSNDNNTTPERDNRSISSTDKQNLRRM